MDRLVGAPSDRKRPTSPAWHALDAEQALAALGSSPAGLKEVEAQARLQREGPNTLPRPHGPSTFELLARQFHNPIVSLLLAAAVLALTLGKWTDGLVVLGALWVNAVIGFWQERRAGQAMQALAQMVPQEATVLRNGHPCHVPAALLVPGDVIQLGPGDRVPADVRLLTTRSLRTEEAALTGESLPVEKGAAPVEARTALADRTAMAFGGTLVAQGTGVGLVVATGAHTELGRISRLLEAVVELETPLTQALTRIGRALTGAVLALALALMAVALWRGYGLVDAALSAMALAVATIPEGLPAIITIALAIGVQRMAAHKAVVRKLPSVETLGSTTVICSDKTGTLTRNEMTVQALWVPSGRYRVSGVGYAPDGQLLDAQGEPLTSVPDDVRALLRAGVLCNDAWVAEGPTGLRVSGEPTEAALLLPAAKAGLDPRTLRQAFPRVDVLPFASEHRYMATSHHGTPRVSPAPADLLEVKGAPEVVLRNVRLPPGHDLESVMAEVEQMAALGMRVLAFAEGPLPTLDEGPLAERLGPASLAGLTLVGLQGMMDAPRPEAIQALAQCRTAGVTVKMMTGDHPATARAMGRALGLLQEGEDALLGAELEHLPDQALRLAVKEHQVFARVAPEHKLRLVKALQASGEVVAMTGDGVNDAPALKQANIGVAMGLTGTAVSKEAADMVLTDDNFATLAAAVREGRRIYDNLQKSLAFILPTNLGLGFILIAAVLFFPIQQVDAAWAPLMPVLPTQLLWVNLVTSVALSLPLAFEVQEPDVMQRPPRRADAPVLSRFVLWRTLLAAVLMALCAVGLFLWEYSRERATEGHAAALAEAQTMAVTTVVFFQIFYLLNCRSLNQSVFRIGFFSNRAVFVGIGVLTLLQAAFIYLPPLQRLFGTAPLDGPSLLLAAAAGAVILPVITLEKALRGHRAPLPGGD